MSQTNPAPSTLNFNFNFQAPKPPSREETTGNPARTLEWISDRITEIYTLNKPKDQHQEGEGGDATAARGAYLDIYTAVHDYCVATKHTPQDQHPNAMDLYRSLEDGIRVYCHESAKEIEAAPNTLEVYVERWAGFLGLSKRVLHLFQTFQDQVLRREIDEKREGVRTIPELHLLVWKEEVLLGGGEGRVCGAMLEAQQQNDGSQEDQRVLEDSVASLEKVGLALGKGGFVALG